MPSSRPLAFVTGASAGIGAEIAKDLARRGHDIIGTGRSDSIDTVADEIRALGVEVHPIRADLGSFDGVEQLWKDVTAVGRPLDVAVLNAGLSIGGAFATDTDLEAELNLIAVNIDAVVHLAKRVVPTMTEKGSGRILITSSISATQPTPYETVYGPSKAFGYMFAESLREELRDTGVTVTTLLPGATDSNFHQRAGMGNTSFGDSMQKNDKTQVARQGVDALLAGRDAVVGGNLQTKLKRVINRYTSEPRKARKHAVAAKPR